MALEVLTNEGVSTLALAAASGPRLVVEFAYAGSKADLEAAGFTESLESYATVKASDVAAWAAKEGDKSCTLPCVALLPSTVTMEDDAATQLEPRAAIDCEFSWLPNSERSFDTIAVFGRLYYGYSEYLPGTYVVGNVVWHKDDTAKYYRCIADVEVTQAGDPADDAEHWQEVTMSPLAIGTEPLRAVAGADTLCLLHLSTTDAPITVTPGVELNYKLRLFLNNAGFDMSDKERCPIYLESVVPAGDAALQLGFLKEMSESMATMRQCIANAYGG